MSKNDGQRKNAVHNYIFKLKQPFSDCCSNYFGNFGLFVYINVDCRSEVAMSRKQFHSKTQLKMPTFGKILATTLCLKKLHDSIHSIGGQKKSNS